MGAELFGESFFFPRDFFFFLVGGGFGAVQAPFWENAGVKCRLVLRLSRLRSGETSGEIRFGQEKTASKSKSSRSFLFSVCIYLR